MSKVAEFVNLVLIFILAAESYALVDFVDEQCYGVVPTQRILHCNVIELSRGDDVTILWDDNKEYFARFIVACLSLI